MYKLLDRTHLYVLAAIRKAQSEHNTETKVVRFRYTGFKLHNPHPLSLEKHEALLKESVTK